jgi:crotonobetainyl-CoA:carnitine CoA-transferase CaiB-like acyl-CoA transferase
MSKALDNLVVDFTTTFWGAMAAAMLGDFGASVVRVEPLGEARQHRAARGCGEPPSQWNARFELANRNKQSLAVDLDAEEGRRILGELVAKADVVITDRPGAELVALGMDYETLGAAMPHLVYALGSGFGPEGPDADLPAIDELAAARTGMMPILPQPEQPPVYAGHGQMYTSVMLAFGVATALFHRRSTGEGQMVDASLLGGNMYGASLDLQAYLAIGGDRLLKPVSRLDAGNPMSGTTYPTEDGRWVTLTMPDTDRYWPQLAESIDLDPADPRFDSHTKRCDENRLELMAIFDKAFRKKPAAHWRKVFADKQMSADVIEGYDYPASDPAARTNRYILDLEDPSLGTQSMIGFPIYMTDTPARLRAKAPALGQHSAEVLHDLLGYAEDHIVTLRRDGVIAG